MAHPPKRISIACTYCRYRKRKCDGQTPTCRTCRVKGLRCKYLDPEAEKDEEGPPHQTQAQRLDVIESLLHQQSEYLDALRQQIPQPHSNSSNDAAYLGTSRPRSSVPTGSSSSTYLSAYSSPLSVGGIETDSSSLQDKHEKIVPPPGHLNAHPSSLSDLLKLPQVCQLIGSYSEEFFQRIENSRERLQMANGVMEAGELELDEETVNACFVHFSKLVHPFHPFLECRMSFARYNEVMARGIKSDSDSAFALAILALGATAADPIDHGNRGRAYSGDLYIQRCLKIILPLWSVSFCPDIMICETLLLCALYFSYTVDPTMTWRFAHMASISIKQAMDCPDKLETETAYIFMRLSWVCFVIERDTLLESKFPKSNIAQKEDEIPLPGYQGTDFPRSFFALADISAHIILERLLDTLASLNQKRIAESSSTIKCPDPQGRLASELNHQLEAWYNALPEPIKPDLTGVEKGNKQQCQLRLRYWNIKQIIFRPLVIYATSPDYEGSCYSAMEAICACIEACRNYVYNAHHILSARTPYSYCVIQSCFASVITLAVAAQEQVLKQHVGDFPAIIKEALNVIGPWAQGDTSVKALYDIMTVLAMKVQYGS